MRFVILLASFAGALLLATLFWRLRRYARALRIRASRDDAFVFGAALQTYAVTLARDGFEAPAGVDSTQTILLELRVRCGWRGHWSEPFIEVEHAGRRQRQYFERGARGQRYLNLTRMTGEKRIALSGHGITWDAPAKLLTFARPNLANAPLLVLAPHPDDSEIAAFGLYSGSNAWIVTITAGERSTTDVSAAGMERAAQAGWLARLRVRDSLYIPQLGGIPRERCVNLVYPDARLSAMREHPGRSFQLACEPGCTRASLRALNAAPEYQHADSDCRWPDLIADLRTLIDAQRPDVVVCPHPWLDSHIDHQATAAALAEALRSSCHRPALFLLYSAHAGKTSLFPFGEAHGCVSLPPGRCSEPIADSLYSHPLDAALREGKYFALEAAHDLRTYHESGRAPPAKLIGRALRLLSAFVSGMPLSPSNYLRRAARPNEIFLLVDAAGLTRLTSSAPP